MTTRWTASRRTKSCWGLPASRSTTCVSAGTARPLITHRIASTHSTPEYSGSLLAEGLCYRCWFLLTLGIGCVCADSEQRRPSQVLHPAAPDAAPRLVRRDGPKTRGPALLRPNPCRLPASPRTHSCVCPCLWPAALVRSSGRRLQRHTNLVWRRRAWCTHQQQQCCGHAVSGGIACVLEASRAGACDRQLQQQRNRRDAADRRGYPLQQATRDCPATAIALFPRLDLCLPSRRVATVAF
jgi:hypothetical protein